MKFVLVFVLLISSLAFGKVANQHGGVKSSPSSEPSLMKQKSNNREYKVYVKNVCSTTVNYLYATHSDTDSWGRDLLGEYVLPENYRYRIDVTAGGCSYDFKVKFSGGTILEKYGINICNNNYVIVGCSYIYGDNY